MEPRSRSRTIGPRFQVPRSRSPSLDPCPLAHVSGQGSGPRSPGLGFQVPGSESLGPGPGAGTRDRRQENVQIVAALFAPKRIESKRIQKSRIESNRESRKLQVIHDFVCFESNRVEKSRIESSRKESKRVESSRVEKSRKESNRVESSSHLFLLVSKQIDTNSGAGLAPRQIRIWRPRPR